MNHDSEVTVLRIDGNCADTNTCYGLHDVGRDISPDYLNLVVRDETDPQVLAKLTSRVGPGERVVRWPRRIGLPEVPPS